MVDIVRIGDAMLINGDCLGRGLAGVCGGVFHMMYDKKDVHAAMYKAAAHIERAPQDYAYYAHYAPGADAAAPACLWGWTGHYLEMYGAGNWKVAEACGVRPSALYAQLRDSENAQTCAEDLRAFAEAFK